MDSPYRLFCYDELDIFHAVDGPISRRHSRAGGNLAYKICLWILAIAAMTKSPCMQYIEFVRDA
jgi:hypothetical protein